ncbi:urease accessory protein UreE [Enterococcus hirae]|uniref:Urease accessory protein UreE n=1 Tax=Candidatus Enterococcus wittei TaxID=1987383 RepID=A0A242K0H7_9ENTE|nr:MULTISPECIES: urease accessory protein UreE [Enterococcus]MBO1117595.1 urease accessory protein UreE [Enterococcus hirae]OTP11161.1 hypothetical protein A5844_001295 [Enterococcus sp. 10A9_DIV0425]THE13550.1 urease accessory protein UreE [Enterococcus hirae]
MIFTNISGKIDDLTNKEDYHIEVAELASDDLSKRVIRVTSDHGNEFGIRLSDESDELKNGSYFLIDDKNILVLSVIPEKMIVIKPKDIDEMGKIAHLLGNTHKPIEVEDGTIKLAIDPVVLDVLNHRQIEYRTEKIALNSPLRHVNLAHAHG